MMKSQLRFQIFLKVFLLGHKLYRDTPVTETSTITSFVSTEARNYTSFYEMLMRVRLRVLPRHFESFHRGGI